MNWTRWFKPLMALLAIVCLIETHWAQQQLNRDRDRLGLTQVSPLDNAPPVLAFTTIALGGFRGLIASALWVRATDMGDKGKYFEQVQLADWITKLQPRFTGVWVNQAWNLVYNISIKFSDFRERWVWVRSGIELIRDQGLRYNPKEPLMYRELAWFFQHKIGSFLDDAHVFYKQAWSDEMTQVIGTFPPNYDALLNPKTEADRQRVKTLREKYKLEPAIMKEVDERYGPLEWRLPETHAIYWATLGMKRCPKTNDIMVLRRVIYQDLKLAFERGRLIENKFTHMIQLGPNLDMIPSANRAYLEFMHLDPQYEDNLRTAHKNFLKNAIFYLYSYNRVTEASRWLKTYAENYPDQPMVYGDKNSLPGRITLDAYMVARYAEDLGDTSTDTMRATVEGLISNSYYNLAIGEDEQASSYGMLSKKVWQHFTDKLAGTGSEQRQGLPPYEDMRAEVLQTVLQQADQINPAIGNNLRSRLNLPPATNAPAITPAP